MPAPRNTASARACGPASYLRAGYTRRNGRVVPPACLRRTSVHAVPAAAEVAAERKARLRAALQKLPAWVRAHAANAPRCATRKQRSVRAAYGTASGRFVRAACVPGAATRRAKSAVRIGPLRRNELGAFGYRDTKHMSAEARHAALAKAAAQLTALGVRRKLLVLSLFNRKRDPAASARFAADAEFVRSALGGDHADFAAIAARA
jgi:hypothetical protein